MNGGKEHTGENTRRAVMKQEQARKRIEKVATNIADMTKY
jgi:hypothetical protein